MKIFVLKVIKSLAIHFAAKYAAELLVSAAIEAAEKLAAKTETKIDDEAVAKLKADRAELVKIISGKA